MTFIETPQKHIFDQDMVRGVIESITMYLESCGVKGYDFTANNWKIRMKQKEKK
jgi:hypothetical protein